MSGGSTGIVASAHRARLDRTVRRVHALLLVTFAAVTVASRPADPLHLLLAAGHVALALGVVLVGERRWHVVPALAMVVLAAGPSFSSAGDVAAGVAMGAALLSAVRTLDRVGYAVVAVLAVGLHSTVQVLQGSFHDLPVVLGTYLLAVTNCLVAGVLVESLERRTDQLDAAEARTVAARLATIEDEEERRAVAAAVRVLHDDVLNALRGLSGDASRSVESVRRDACAAVEAVDAVVTGTADVAERRVDALDRLRSAVVAHAPVRVRLDHDLVEPVLDLGEDQQAALTRAVLEALRNVRRHTAADHADVLVLGRPDRVEVRVRDDGGGFAPGAVPGVGITDSIRGAVEAAGGRATVESTGAGVSVTVAFADAPAAGAGALERAWRLTLGDDVGLVARVLLPLAVVWVPIGGWYAARSARPLLGLLLLVAAAALPVATIARLGRRAFSATWLLGFGAALTAGQLAGLGLTPDGGLLDFRSWPVGFLAASLTVVCLVVPWRWAAGLVLSQVAVLLVAVVARPALSDGVVPVTTLNAWVSPPLVTTVLGLALRRNGLRVEAEHRSLAAAYAERVRRRSLATVGQVHLDHTRRVVIPWLRRVAEGHLDPSDPAVQREARRLALETRDDLHAPGFHDPELRRRVGAFRDRGGRVDISPGFPGGAGARPSGRLLTGLVERLPGGHRVGLSEGAAGVRLVVTPPPEGSVLDALDVPPGTQVGGDEFALVLEFEDGAR